MPATSTVIANPTVATIYTVTGSNGGCASTKTIAVGITPPHAISVSDTHPGGQRCPGFTYTISASGSSTYTWSTGQVGTSIVVSPTVPTSYTATTNPGGCISTNTVASYPYTMLAKPSVSLSSSASVTCVNSNITLTGSPTGGVYSGSNVVGSNFNSPSVGTFTATYSYTNTATTCTNSATKTVSVSLCTGVVELNGVEASLISIYPNPNNGEFTISIPTKGTYSIVNAIGQTVEVIDLKEDAQHINVSGLSQGIYYIIGKTSKAKVIVTK